MPEEQYLNAEQAARFLDTTKAALYQLTCRRRLPYFRPGGGRIYFKLADLQEYIESARIPSAVGLLPGSKNGKTKRMSFEGYALPRVTT